MKKILLIFVCAVFSVKGFAGDGYHYFTLNAGFLFPNTLNATLGYERELEYGNAVELFGEVGNRWRKDPTCGKVCKDVFWKGYYWDGGLLYKQRLVRYKNGLLRFRLGPQFGAEKGNYFFGLEGGFEYNYIFPSGVQFFLVQKNNVNFLHGDTFRNGLLIGIKIPF